MYSHRSKSYRSYDDNDDDDAVVAQNPESSVELVEFDPITSAPTVTHHSQDQPGSSSERKSTHWKARWKGRNKAETLQQQRNNKEEIRGGEDHSGQGHPAPEGYGEGEEEIADMKFSHSIQFNAVQEWSNYYIAYSNLKKL